MDWRESGRERERERERECGWRSVRERIWERTRGIYVLETEKERVGAGNGKRERNREETECWGRRKEGET
jgi:hypothetical protein